MKIIDKLLGADKWRTVRSIWPYPEGYAVVKGYGENKTILHTGLSLEEANAEVEKLNNEKEI